MKVHKWSFILAALVMLLGVINVVNQVAERFSYHGILITTIALCGWVIAIGALIHLLRRDREE